MTLKTLRYFCIAQIVRPTHTYRQALNGAISIQMSDCPGSVGTRAIRIAGGHNSNALRPLASRPVATYVPVTNPATAKANIHQTFRAIIAGSVSWLVVVVRRYRNFEPFIRQIGERKAQTCAKAMLRQHRQSCVKIAAWKAPWTLRDGYL